ncbi:MAG TPA: L,D-transpeptidase [Coleofasciculaceae cyanobacterium]
MSRQTCNPLSRLGLWSTLLGLALGMPEVWMSPLLPPAQAQTGAAQEIASLRQSNQRWIEINVSTERLIAWEGNTPVYAVVVSTGTERHPTLTGTFAIQTKLRTARMQGEDYDIPDVPYTMYYAGSYAIHGAYWHNSFGTPVSHGCVNVAVNHARWLFNWASVGTPVVVHD